MLLLIGIAGWILGELASRAVTRLRGAHVRPPWAKLPNALLVAACVAYAVRMLDGAALRQGGLALALPVAAFGAFNLYAFGAPWVTSYDRVIDRFEAGRATLQASHRTFFDVPLALGLWRQLVDPKNGLLVSAPPLVLAAFGLRALLRRAPAVGWLVVSLGPCSS